MKPNLKHWKDKAQTVLQDKELLGSLLKEAVIKADQNKSRIRRIWSNLKALTRMVKAWVRGEYRNIPIKTLVSAVAAILYFLNPFDIVPDFLPVGLIDDALFVGWVLSAIQADLEKFLVWERTVPVVAEKIE